MTFTRDGHLHSWIPALLVCLILLGLSLAFVNPAMARQIDYSQWNREFGNGDWIVSGNSVEQTINSEVTGFISDFEMGEFSLIMTMSIALDAGDDDFIGFLFCYRDIDHYYFFDWRQNDQNDPTYGFGKRGMAINRVNGTDHDNWSHSGNNFLELARNSVPWEHGHTYEVRITFGGNQISLVVMDKGTSSNPTNVQIGALQANDDYYLRGRLGFYNFSQPKTTYHMTSLTDEKNLRGRWQMNSSYGFKVYDSSFKDNNGSKPLTTQNLIDKKPKWVDSTVADQFENYELDGYALAFDGTADSYVTVPDSDSLDLNDVMTTEFWFKPNKVQSPRATLIDRSYTADNKGWIIRYDDFAQTVCLIVGDGSASSQPLCTLEPVLDQRWHHLAGVVDGDTVALYLDGNFQGYAAWPRAYPIAIHDRPLFFGKAYDSNQGVAYKGELDEISIYEYPFDEWEVAVAYEFWTYGLAGRWNFDTLATSNSSLNEQKLELALPTAPAKLDRPAAISEATAFGQSVALSGYKAVIGAPYDSLTGSANIYAWDGGYQLETQLWPSNSNDMVFGASVGISGDAVIVGAPYSPDSSGEILSVGSAYIYRYGDGWYEEQRLAMSEGSTNDSFGTAVAIEGDYALVSAPGENNATGAAYIFHWNGSTWLQVQKLVAQNGEVGDYFGLSVALSNGLVAISASSSAGGYVTIFENSSGSWVQTKKLTASEGSVEDFFGMSIALSGNTVFVGAPYANSYQGKAYAYRKNGNTWNETIIEATDGAANDAFGANLAISGNVALIGAYGNNNAQGATYFYRWNGNRWNQEQKITASDGVSGDAFGVSNAIDSSSELMLIGASGVNGSAGAGYAYDVPPPAAIMDLSNQANHAVIMGGTQADSDLGPSLLGVGTGKMMTFNGTDQYLFVANNPSLQFGLMAAEAWVKPTNNAKTQTIISKRREWAFIISDQGYLQFALSNSGYNRFYGSATSTVSMGVWSHVAATWNGDELRLFINGQLKESFSVNPSGWMYPGTTDVYIGAMENTDGVPENFFDGDMETVSVWKMPRDVWEIAARYEWISRTGWPVAVMATPLNEQIITLGQEVTFDASASYDPAGSSGKKNIVKYFWDFRDGIPLTTTSGIQKHTFTTMPSGGWTQVFVSVQDGDGFFNGTFVNLEVKSSMTMNDYKKNTTIKVNKARATRSQK
jgi:hypothetical protein